MIKNKALRFVFLAIVLVMLAIGAFAFSIQSHAAAPSSISSNAKVPHVSILRHKGGTAWGQSAVSMAHGVAFTFINRTNTSQSVLDSKGKTLLSIPAKSSAPYTWKSAGGFTYTLASNSSAVLTVTVS